MHGAGREDHRHRRALGILPVIGQDDGVRPGAARVLGEEAAPSASAAEAAGEDEEAGLPVERVQVLARRVAELHLALAQRTGAAAFEPEPIEARDLQAWASAVRDECVNTMALLEAQHVSWAPALAELAGHVLQAKAALFARIDRVAQASPVGLKTRVHGDLHLEQILICRDDFFIIDFEGEPQRSFEQRRAK